MVFSRPIALVRTLWLAACICIAATGSAVCQDLDEDEETDADGYDREFNYGVNFNTVGGLIGGGMVKYAWARPHGYYQRVMLEICNVKHPKEYRARGEINSFIPYKTNYLFAVRPSFGLEKLLFRKAPEQGVQLNVIAAVGPTIAVLKPYYVLYSDVGDPNLAVSQPFDPTTMKPNNIFGVGRVSDGFDNLSAVPGLHGRLGLTFETGRYRSSVVGIEAGFLGEVYAKPIRLMQGFSASDTYKKLSALTSFYLTIYYGKKQ